MRIRLLLLSFLLLGAAAFAQPIYPGGVQYVVTAPSGTCVAGSPIQQVINGAGTVYACQSITGGLGTWTALSSSGASGTVTSVTVAGTTNEISVAGTCTITLSGTCTLSLPSTVILPGTLQVTGNLTTNMTGGPLCVHETSGVLSAAAADCGSGGGGDTITSPNSTLSIGGTATNTTLDINPAHANTWSATQSFGALTASGTVTLSGITGSTQCLNVNSSGVISGTGSTCGTGGSSIFTSYQFGSSTAITGSGNYVQTTYPSTLLSTAQTGSGTSGSPYVDAITLASIAADTVWGNPTGSSATPIATTNPVVGTVTANTSVAVGTAPVGCGTATTCLAMTEGSTSGIVPTSGTDLCAADSTQHGFVCDINGGSSFFSAMNYPPTSSAFQTFPLTVAGTINSGGVPCFNSTTNEESSVTLGSSQILLGGGSGGCIASDSAATLSSGTLSLGSSGVYGGVVLGNAMSGTVTLQAISGSALGSVVASLPGNTGTVAETNLAQTFTALQTLGSNASIGTTAHGVLLSENASAAVATSAGAIGTFLAGAGASTDPSFVALSAINPQTATYQVLVADFSSYKTITVASGTFTITLVASGSQPANGQYINIVNYGSGVVTIARSGQNINGGTTSITLNAASATNSTSAMIWSDGTNYFAAIDEDNSNTGTVTTVSVATANGFSGTVANATTTPAITLTPSAHGISLPIVCAAASGSGTTYTCTTNPSFTPADGDIILFQADLANTGAATLAVNGQSGPPGIKKQGGGTALVANDMLAGQDTLMEYDGTNWQMQGQTGNAPAGAVSSVNTLTGAVVIEAAASGQMAVSGGSGAALTGAADMTYSGHTFSTLTTGIFDWSAATGAGALKLPPVIGGTQLSGTSTANLSAPMVIQNTNSSNNNTSITLGITSPGTSTGQTTLNINGATTGGDLLDFGTGGTWASGVLSGQTNVAKVGITGGFTGLNFTSNGTTAGFIDLPQGSTSGSTAPCNTATSICIQAPTSVTSQLRVLAGAPATGFSLFTNSSGTMTETISATAGTLTSGVGTWGNSAINTVLASTVANVAGHFTNLQVVTSLFNTCTTVPIFNVFDGTTNTGSTVTATGSTQTKGTGTSTAQTLTFASGDIIGIYISTAGATCTADLFTVTAQYSVP